MSKAVKLKNNTYLSSKSVYQNQMTFSGQWFTFVKVSGAGWTCIIPFLNTLDRTPILNISSASYFASGWHTITPTNVKVRHSLETFTMIWIDENLSNATSDTLLVTMVGTISV